MLSSVLRRSAHGSSSAAVPVAVGSIERAAPYTKFMTLRPHAHHEPNFRARPMAMKGYNDPKLQDPYAPFAIQTPTRHVDRTACGIWFGMGHFALKNFFGPFHIRFALRLLTWGLLGLLFGAFIYCHRMIRNGWEWKNRGAVFSVE